ncbi:helix-turn-helix domain-containing protein [Streptomyces aurantiogriseus]|uniref:HTH cro/C1-type domain-containing protein n=1 Tax=Streptomyces aurantiogriseus TaxID=66870 RepID=A0A918C193_9ACTN|nr:XRE family transcriptional regulator [Streptomyces aurantiogriseus]GGR00588.1 hypothetical protein GCM10010251_15030 [Streptomyces aurantiogriseus]
MPRWKNLPDELDPQVKEFARQLRQVVDRSGLNVTQLADRTHYGRASWERYLNGRLLAPKGAVVALAEVTGADPAHLITLWELAERAWSRAELRDDLGSEAVRLSRARTVTTPATGRAGPTDVSPTSPPPPPPVPVPEDPGGTSPEGPGATSPEGPGPATPGRRARRPALFLAGVAGVAIVTAGAFFLDGGAPEQNRTTAGPPSPSASPHPSLPPGVHCHGADCEGKDAEQMGCSGNLVTTAKSATVGTTLVEVRYSRTCGAAWGRITQAGVGDVVRVTVGSTRRTGDITTAGDTIAYTPMVAVKEAAEAQACAVLASGQQGCTP